MKRSFYAALIGAVLWVTGCGGGSNETQQGVPFTPGLFAGDVSIEETTEGPNLGCEPFRASYSFFRLLVERNSFGITINDYDPNLEGSLASRELGRVGTEQTELAFADQISFSQDPTFPVDTICTASNTGTLSSREGAIRLETVLDGFCKSERASLPCKLSLNGELQREDGT